MDIRDMRPTIMDRIGQRIDDIGQEHDGIDDEIDRPHEHQGGLREERNRLMDRHTAILDIPDAEVERVVGEIEAGEPTPEVTGGNGSRSGGQRKRLRTEMPRSPSEAEMLTGIDDLVRLKGGRLWRIADSRNCPETADLWDVSILVPGWAMLLELKSQHRGWESAGQQEVAARLADVRRIACGIVRPDPRPGEYSYQEILDVLAGVL